MLVSEYLNLTDELDNLGVFDALIDTDNPFFINILRLKDVANSKSIPELVDSYEHVNEFYRKLIKLLDFAKVPDQKDSFYRQAYRIFQFSEVNEINLGFAEGTSGSGFGPELRSHVLEHGFNIVKAGCKDPEIFQLMALFEEGVAGDRISDMISSIILPDIREYTKRILHDLKINKSSRPSLQFDADGYLLNPYKKKCQILLLPTEILHKLTITKEWEDVEDAISRNISIRNAMNRTVMDQWSKYSSKEKKEAIRRGIFENPHKCEEVISSYRSEQLDKLDVLGADSDPGYAAKKYARNYEINGADFKSKVSGKIDSHTAAIEILDIFREWVENQKGWEPIQAYSTHKGEKFVQRYIAACAVYYVDVNDLDISFEANEGRGPVDVKVSRGKDKTLIEVKLSSNQDYLHGYEEQVEEYGKAERTDSLIYLYVDIDNPERTDNIRRTCANAKRANDKAPDLYLIDARKKASASKYYAFGSYKYGLYNPGAVSDMASNNTDDIFKGLEDLDLDKLDLDLDDTLKNMKWNLPDGWDADLDWGDKEKK